MHSSIHLFIHLPISHPSIHPLSIFYPPTYPSCSCINTATHRFIHLFAQPVIYTSVCPSIHQSIPSYLITYFLYILFCLSVYLKTLNGRFSCVQVCSIRETLIVCVHESASSPVGGENVSGVERKLSGSLTCSIPFRWWRWHSSHCSHTDSWDPRTAELRSNRQETEEHYTHSLTPSLTKSLTYEV